MTRNQRLAVFLRRAKITVLCLAFLVGATFIVAYTTLVPAQRLNLSVGEVAPADILAPHSLSYESAVLTRLAQQTAIKEVSRIYDPPDPAVLRQQAQLARLSLDFITHVRADSYSTQPRRIADITAMTPLSLDADQAARLLEMTEASWKVVEAQVVQTLERAMRSNIREDTLPGILANLPNLVSLEVTEQQANLIVSIVSDFIRPNTFYNAERTRAAEEARAAAVSPVMRSFIQGQIVLRAGSLINDADIEALAQFRLLEPADARGRVVAGVGMAVLLLTMLGTVYIRRFQPSLLEDTPRMVLIGILFLFFLAGSRFYGTNDFFLSHLYPAAAFALIVVALVNPQIAIMLNVALAALIGIIMGGSFEYAMLTAAAGTAGVLTLRKTDRLPAYFAAGLMIGLTNLAAGVLFSLIRGDSPGQVLLLLPAGLLNGGLAAGIGLVGLYIVSSLLNIPTSVKLLELSQPNHPLLQRLLREAPGTYQHSLQVANLAELAAERVGANAALVRVGALYHDIGKLFAPQYFAENQLEGAVNPHDSLSPEASARVIISHVTEGEKLARRHRLPLALIDLIMQHHGTTRALYFYNKALEAAQCDASKVDQAAFTYPGPRPQTREAGIMMMADTSESVVRSKRLRDKTEIALTVQEIMQSRLECGQLDQSGLTVSDLRIIQEAFVSSLQGVFHPRLVYPSAPRTTQELPGIQPKPMGQDARL